MQALPNMTVGFFRYLLLFGALAMTAASAQTSSETIVEMPAGSFMMGNAFADEGFPAESPRREVTTAAYRIADRPVTLGLWQEVRDWALQNGYPDLPEGIAQGEEHPVSGVSWYDMLKWCNARSEKEGLSPLYYVDAEHSLVYREGVVGIGNAQVDWASQGYRLPLEAEWERAARGGLDGQRYITGDTMDSSQANIFVEDYAHPAEALPYTSPVTHYAASDGGLYDMAGNLWEWCWDRYDPDYYLREDSTIQPKGAEQGVLRVLRGGSWDSEPESARLSAREADVPAAAYYGFRVVLTEAGIPPVIVTQPVSVNASLNNVATFVVEVLDPSDQTLVYQWYKDGGRLEGQTASSLILSRVGPSDVGNYSVDISNAYGTVSSDTVELVLSRYSPDDLINYSLNPDPMNSKGILSYLPTLAIVGGSLTFSFTAQADDVNYTVQKSSDLVQWTDVASSDGQAVLDTSAAERQFVRLKVDSAVASGTALTASTDEDGTVYACTKPQGYVTITIPQGAATTYFGNPLESPAVYRFEVESVTTNTMTFADAAFETDQFVTTGPYWLRVISGNQAGRHMLIEANTANTLTLDLMDGTTTEVTLTETDWAIQAGDIVEIAPADTLQKFFENIITPAANAFSAERVNLWTGARWVSYYNSATNGWIGEGNVPVEEDVIIRPQDAWAIRTNRSEETTIVLTGTVPEQPVLVRHTGGAASVITANRFPVDLELADFHFQGPGEWKTGSAFGADAIGLWTGARWVNNYKAASGAWMQTGSGASTEDQSAVSVKSGDVMNVLVRGTASGTKQFFSLPIPYPNPRE